MKQIIILILIFSFILYLYGEFQLRFGNKRDNYIKILEVLTFLLTIVAIISRKWWICILVFIMLLVLVISPSRVFNFLRKAFNKLKDLFEGQKN